MKYSITIPTLKSNDEITALLAELKASILKDDAKDVEIYASCKPQSAASNRNECIYSTKGDYIIMIDDDVHTFPVGWYRVLAEYADVYAVVSARLVNRAGQVATMMSYGHTLPQRGIHVVDSVPGACICFTRNIAERIVAESKYPHNLPFDANFIAAEFEDTDFCVIARELTQKPIAVTNEVRVVHDNEEKWRKSNAHDTNKAYFDRKHTER